MPKAIPYKIASLCYLFDDQGRTLLLHRIKPPNADRYSPIGGKLETAIGESPTACAVREIHEEVGLAVSPDDLHLTGMVSERAYENQTHWLMFLYEVTHPVDLAPGTFDEGSFDWYTREQIDQLPIPESDAKVIWPAFWAHRGGFFAAHLDCGDGPITWQIEQSHRPAQA
ncbi:MAG: NUDIX domain-containing protein [Algisphaera sp.]